MTSRSKRAVRMVVRAVCAYYEVREAPLLSASRVPELVEARRVIMTILHEDLGLGSQEIGRLVHRDHSTVAHHLGRTDYPVCWSAAATEALADVRAALSGEERLRHA